MITSHFGALIRFNHIPDGIVGVGHEHPKFIEAHPFGGGDVFSGLWVGCLLLGGMHVEPMGFFQHHLPCQLIGVECGWQFTGDVQVGRVVEDLGKRTDRRQRRAQLVRHRR